MTRFPLVAAAVAITLAAPVAAQTSVTAGLTVDGTVITIQVDRPAAAQGPAYGSSWHMRGSRTGLVALASGIALACCERPALIHAVKGPHGAGPGRPGERSTRSVPPAVSADLAQMGDPEPFGRFQAQTQHPVQTGMSDPERAERGDTARAAGQAEGEQDPPDCVDMDDV